jgi:predicted nuclease of predicted toxin-antitoxin system
MKFIADVNIPQSVIHALESNNHNVLDIKKSKLKAPDTELIRIARKQKRIILTLDKDFISLTQFPGHQAPTIVFRLINQKSKHILEHLQELLNNQQAKLLQRSLTIVKEGSANSYPYSS